MIPGYPVAHASWIKTAHHLHLASPLVFPGGENCACTRAPHTALHTTHLSHHARPTHHPAPKPPRANELCRCLVQEEHAEKAMCRNRDYAFKKLPGSDVTRQLHAVKNMWTRHRSDLVNRRMASSSRVRILQKKKSPSKTHAHPTPPRTHTPTHTP